MNSNVINILGAGSWGTALAIMLANNNLNVGLWGHQEEHIGNLEKDRENKKHLLGIRFPKKLKIYHNFQELQEGKIFIMAVPSQSYRGVFKKLLPGVNEGSFCISATKGIENNSLLSMIEVMKDEWTLNNTKPEKLELGVLTGPSFAKEVALGMPTAVTLGFENLTTAVKLQSILGNTMFRVYSSNDVVGLELCGAYKNVIAIATGISEGLGYGLNTRAALITRGLAEIKRLGSILGAQENTFSGLSGLGDLILTCTGDLSRNRSIGISLGKGLTIEEAIKKLNTVAEGVKTTKSLWDLTQKMNLDMPILEQVYKIIYCKKSCINAVSDLLQREFTVEI